MMTVTAHIDVSTPQGRKIVMELEKHKKYVQIDNPFPLGEDGNPIETFSVEESFEKLWKKMDEHYGYDIRKKWKPIESELPNRLTKWMIPSAIAKKQE